MHFNDIIDDSDVACIRRIVGEASFQKLVASISGVQLYVPKCGVPEDHPISVAVGPEQASAIAAEFGGSYIYIPIHPADRRTDIVRRLTLAGASILDIVREAQVSARRVYQIRRRLRREGKLPPANESRTAHFSRKID